MARAKKVPMAATLLLPTVSRRRGQHRLPTGPDPPQFLSSEPRHAAYCKRLPVGPPGNLDRCPQVSPNVRTDATFLDNRRMRLVSLYPSAQVLLGRQHQALGVVA